MGRHLPGLELETAVSAVASMHLPGLAYSSPSPRSWGPYLLPTACWRCAPHCRSSRGSQWHRCPPCSSHRSAFSLASPSKFFHPMCLLFFGTECLEGLCVLLPPLIVHCLNPPWASTEAAHGRLVGAQSPSVVDLAFSALALASLSLFLFLVQPLVSEPPRTQSWLSLASSSFLVNSSSLYFHKCPCFPPAQSCLFESRLTDCPWALLA